MIKISATLAIITALILPSVFTMPQYYSDFGNSSPFEIELADEVVHLVQTCFTNVNRLVTLSGRVSEKLAIKIHESESLAVARMSMEVPSLDEAYVIAKQSMQKYHFENYFRFAHNAHGFILAASSHPILHKQIRDLKNSRWWNAGALFMIIDAGEAVHKSCNNAENFLWLAWQYGMLSSIFLCHDKSEGLSIYSYSPYNDIAPKSWLKVEQRLGRNNHPWILLKRRASQGLENCSETFHDKTKTLNGYKIRTNAVSLPPRLTVDNDKIGFDKYTGQEAKLMQTVFNFLNASVEDVPYRGKDPIGYTDLNGSYWGMLADVFSGRVDIGLNGRYMVLMWQVAISQFYATTDICFLVNSRGNVPQWMNVASVFDLWVSMGLIILISISTAVLIYHGGASAGCLDGIRLVVSVSLVRPPSPVSARLFMGSVLLVVLIFNGLFQGRLVSLLTKPRAYRNPETMSDLVEGGYKVVGYTPFREWIDDPVLRSRYQSENSLLYATTLFGDEKIAKVIDCDAVLESTSYTQPHIVRQRLQSFYLVFISVADWPLMERFNRIIRRLSEAGFPGFWQTRNMFLNTPHKPDDSDGLSLKDLAFIFTWLLSGLTVAAFVFSFEVIFHRYKIGFRRQPRE